MRRHILLTTAVAMLLTLAWLVVPDFKHSPAVLWPSILAVGLAFLTRDIYLALFTGAFAGAVLLHGGNPWSAFLDLFTQRLIPALADRWNLSVLIFTLMMGGLVEVLNRSGGMAALSTRVLGCAGHARRAAWHLSPPVSPPPSQFFRVSRKREDKVEYRPSLAEAGNALNS